MNINLKNLAKTVVNEINVEDETAMVGEWSEM
jgi:hypothetical protein